MAAVAGDHQPGQPLGAGADGDGGRCGHRAGAGEVGVERGRRPGRRSQGDQPAVGGGRQLDAALLAAGELQGVQRWPGDRGGVQDVEDPPAHRVGRVCGCDVHAVAVAGDGQGQTGCRQLPRRQGGVVIGGDLVDGAGAGGRLGQDVQAMRGVVQGDPGRAGQGDRVLPAQARLVRPMAGWLRVDEDVEFEGLADAVGRAGGVVAAAVVVQDGDVLGRALAVAEADLEGVGHPVPASVAVRGQHGHGRYLAQVEGGLLGDEDFVAAAVDRCSRLDDQVAVLAGGVGVLDDAQAADRPGPVQTLMVVA